MSTISFPIMYINDPEKGRPIFNGQMYFGQPDLDPEIAGNQKQVYYIQENGDLVAASQPILLSAGGNPTYNGDAVTLSITGEYSTKVLNKLGVQEYYIARTDSSGDSGSVITYAEDSQTLIAGQLVVDFTGITVAVANIYVGKNSGDRGKLFEGSDYTVTGSSQITLTASFNAGTKLIAASSELVVRDLLSQAYEFPTVAAYKAYSVAFPVGKVVNLLDRKASFTVISGIGTADEFSVIANTSTSQSIVITPSDTLTSEQMGAIGDEVANDTQALKAFFDYCIANEQRGFINAGTYLIDLGVLSFDNNHVSTPFPIINTAGKDLVIFTNSADDNAFYMSFTNGTATTGAGKFWEGGYLGGITFKRSIGSGINTSQHGLVLNGCDYTEFGLLGAEDLGGNGIEIKRNLFGGNNPDPYHVNGCVFAGIEANRCAGYAFFNDNFVALSLCSIGQIRAIENGGVFFGMGASCSIDKISAGSNAGWLIGDETSGLGGASSRFSIGSYEADDQEFGINANRVIDSDFGLGRFVHRYNFGPKNPSGGYWPRKAIDIGTTSSSNISITAIHRIETGGAKIDLGDFTLFNGTANTTATSIYYKVLDNAAFGIDDTDLYTNYNASNTVFMSRDAGLTIIDSIGDNSLLARAPTTYAIPDGGFGTNVVEFSTELKDQSNNYDPVTFQYTVREAGLYDIRAQLNINLTAGQRLRLGVIKNGAVISGSNNYSTATGIETFFYEYRSDLIVGDVISITADNDSGGAVNLSIITGPNDNYLAINRYK